MPYQVKEIFTTLQGEGAQTGTRAVFVRFTGCNLWSGREKDRSSAICKFCDTDFVGTDGVNGGQFATAQELVQRVVEIWTRELEPEQDYARLVICTGGEPMLQLDKALIDALHAREFRIAVESNGSLKIPEDIDWICISPKQGAPLVQKSGNEIKVVWPQDGINLDAYEGLDFHHYFLQPKDDEQLEDNVKRCLKLCHERPKWRLSLQIHKILGID